MELAPEIDYGRSRIATFAAERALCPECAGLSPLALAVMVSTAAMGAGPALLTSDTTDPCMLIRLKSPGRTWLRFPPQG